MASHGALDGGRRIGPDGWRQSVAWRRRQWLPGVVVTLSFIDVVGHMFAWLSGQSERRETCRRRRLASFAPVPGWCPVALSRPPDSET